MTTIIKLDLDKILFSMLGRRELVREWWESPNKHWNNRTPIEVYQGSEEQRQSVISYVTSHASGDYH